MKLSELTVDLHHAIDGVEPVFERPLHADDNRHELLEQRSRTLLDLGAELLDLRRLHILERAGKEI